MYTAEILLEPVLTPMVIACSLLFDPEVKSKGEMGGELVPAILRCAIFVMGNSSVSSHLPSETTTRLLLLLKLLDFCVCG